MGHSEASEILRTTDLSAAFDACGKLLIHANMARLPARLTADITFARTMVGLLTAIPDISTWPPTDLTAMRQHDIAHRGPLSISVDHEAAPPSYAQLKSSMVIGSAERDFATAMAEAPASIDWGVAWNEMPEEGLRYVPNRASVQLSLNQVYWDEIDFPGLHVVYVHLPKGESDRAVWLAKKINSEVSGPSRRGW